MSLFFCCASFVIVHCLFCLFGRWLALAFLVCSQSSFCPPQLPYVNMNRPCTGTKLWRLRRKLIYDRIIRNVNWRYCIAFQWNHCIAIDWIYCITFNWRYCAALIGYFALLLIEDIALLLIEVIALLLIEYIVLLLIEDIALL